MCLWLLTACIGLIPASPPTTNIVIQVPAAIPYPILQPTAAPLPATTSNAPATTTTRATTTAPPTTTTPATTAPPPPPTTPAPTTPAPTTTTQSPIITAIPSVTTTLQTTPLPPPTTLPAVTSSPPSQVLLPVLLCRNAEIVCVLNPDNYKTGPQPVIDPRLGTTPPASAAFRAPPIVGYNSQAPAYDSAVKFPRERRSVGSVNMNISDEGSFKNERHKIRKRQGCVCVQAGTCATYGQGLIDLRIVTPGSGQCPAGQVYCCTGTVNPSPTITVNCGVLQTVPNTGVTPAAGQASFGEYPWQALLLSNQNDYIAGGVLIDQRHVLTVTHRLTSFVVAGTAPNVKVRLGEWDAAVTSEPIPFQEYSVARVFSHPSYNPGTLQYDLTVLRLSMAVPFTSLPGAVPTINRACLPPSATTTYNGQRCRVSGWGKNMFGVTGQYQQILKQVDVPIVDPATCQSQLQTARLGATFKLDTTSFICAGGEANKDSCTGDGGSGLVCQVNGQWVVVGLVAWGLGCANSNVPAAYVNVAALLPWIQQQVAAA